MSSLFRTLRTFRFPRSNISDVNSFREFPDRKSRRDGVSDVNTSSVTGPSDTAGCFVRCRRGRSKSGAMVFKPTLLQQS